MKNFLMFDREPKMPRLGRIGRTRRLLRDPEPHATPPAPGAPVLPAPAPASPAAPAPAPTAPTAPAAPAPTAPVPSPAPVAVPDGYFSQDQVNGIVAKEKAAHKATVEKQVLDLEELKNSKGQSDEARATLGIKIDELNNSLLSAKEKAENEKQTLTKAHETAISVETLRADTNWGLYETTMKSNAITSAASKHSAYRTAQIVAIVSPRCKMVATKDTEGNIIGHDVLVSAKIKQENGTVEEKEVSVDDFVALMKTDPDYLNMFVSDRPGGSGHQPAPGIPVGGNPANMTSGEKVAQGMRAKFGK